MNRAWLGGGIVLVLCVAVAALMGGSDPVPDTSPAAEGGTETSEQPQERLKYANWEIPDDEVVEDDDYVAPPPLGDEKERAALARKLAKRFEGTEISMPVPGGAGGGNKR